MATTQYIGPRIIPVFAPDVEWDITKTYDHLTMVQHQGETFMTRQYVPAGIELPDSAHDVEYNDYWVHMSNWNAQIEAYRQEVLQYNGRISTIEDDLPIADFDSTNTVKKYIDDSIAFDIGKVHVFDDVAIMKANDYLSNGVICRTCGFHDIGDGGAAWYQITDTGTANEIDVIACGDLYAVLIQTEPMINVKQFGAYGDNTHDDYNAIARAIEVGIASKIDVLIPEGFEFLISSGLVISGDIGITMESPVIYQGNETALTIGTKSVRYANNKHFKIMVDSGSYASIQVGSVGVKMINIADSIIDLTLASGFQTNAMFWAYDAPFAYNHVKLGRLTYGEVQLLMQVDDAEHTTLYGWMNENLFTDGRFASAASNPYVNQWTGVKIVSYNNNTPNNNIFIKPNFEGARYCVDIVEGANNQFLNCRSENCTYAMKVAENFKASANYFESGYGSTAVYPNMGAANLTANRYAYIKERMSKCVYDSGYLCERSFSNGSYLFCGSELFYNDGGVIRQIYKGVKEADGVYITGRMLGVRIKCDSNKTFFVTADTANSATFGLCLVLRDSNGDVINTEKSIIGYDGVTYTGNNGTTISNTYSYPASASNRTEYIFTINSDDVYYVDIMLRAISEKVKRYQIYAPVNSENEVIYGVVSNGLDSIPTCVGNAGDYCPNGNSSTIASTLGWVHDGTSWSAVSR